MKTFLRNLTLLFTTGLTELNRDVMNLQLRLKELDELTSKDYAALSNRLDNLHRAVTNILNAQADSLHE